MADKTGLPLCLYECEFVPDRNTAYWRLWTRNKSPIGEQKNNKYYNGGGRGEETKNKHIKITDGPERKRLKTGIRGMASIFPEIV